MVWTAEGESMDNFIVNQTGIQITKDSIERKISMEIVRVNDNYYKKLKSTLANSKGDYVEQMKCLVEKEYVMVNALAKLYMGTLEYMQEAANQATDLDLLFTAPKIELGGK